MFSIKKVFAATITILSMYSCGSSGNVNKLMADKDHKNIISLSGEWDFRSTTTLSGRDDITQWREAKVPGVVHTDLLSHAMIEDPSAGGSEPLLQWIGDETWEYKRTFEVDGEFLAQKNQSLVFEGLDTYANVYLGDSLILSANNMFRTWEVDVTGALSPSGNELRVEFLPAYEQGLIDGEGYMDLPAGNDKGEKVSSIFTRKAPYQFGWDWGPRYLTCGIWRDVKLVGWSGSHIENVQYIQQSQSSEKANFVASVTLQSDNQKSVDLVIANPQGDVYASQNVALTQGENKISIPFEITNPSLWWPQGAGDAHLYPMHMILAEQGSKLDSHFANIGVRTIELLQVPDSVGEGQSFHFEVNGEPIFAKGANYIPMDNFLPNVSPHKYEEFIKMCVESNYNMIRVWGGGIYEDDYLYELCDKYGLMVWQDFAFACSLYPWDDEFLANVEQEAIDNVRRLRNHPSIAIWCGNNEITELWHHWGYQRMYGWNQEQQDTIYAGMQKLFYELIPSVLEREDTTRFYHPSSPLYGRGNPKSQIMGDVHYWGVFHDEEPFSVYKDKPGRFSNEYGFMSLACYDTYREYFSPEQMQLYSDAMIIHQKSPKGYRVMEEYMDRELPILKDDFREYVYLTQILQAEGIKIAMEGHRQKRPWTMGSLYWQVNDLWPVASWSSMDSQMRWKALQFYAKRSFAPSTISFEDVDSTNVVKLWGVNDRLHQVDGELTLSLVGFDGEVYWSQNSQDINIPRNGNLLIMEKSASELLGDVPANEAVLVAKALVGDDWVEKLFYFVPLKDLDLPTEKYDVDYKKVGEHSVEVTITAKTLLKSILFEAEALQGNPSDAYFDMLAGQKRTVMLNFIEPVDSIEELGIFVTTLNSKVHKKGSKPITKDIK